MRATDHSAGQGHAGQERSGQATHVVVVGGGIAGLAAAHRALAAGCRVTVVEASDRVGGKLLPGEIEGARVDLGAESMLARRPEAVALAREAGLGAALQAPATASAALWTRGALVPMPKGHVMGVPGDPSVLAGVLSEDGLRRVARDAELAPTEVGEDVAVGAYVAARVGREVVDRLVEPLLGGVYAGDAYRLSMRMAVPQLYEAARTHGSLLDGVREIQALAAARRQTGPVFMGIAGGVGRLPLAVADAVRARGGEILLGTSVQAVRKTPDGWEVRAADRLIAADAVVLAVPAPHAARLLDPVSPGAAAELRAVEYASMALMTLAYRRADVSLPEGSGFLVPPVEGRTIKASTFASQKWGWIAEENPDLLVLRTSVGRYGEEQDLQRDDDELIDVSRGDLRAAVGLTARPVAARVTRWHDGLPQYPVGHHARVARVRAHVGRLPGLAVCGAAYDGVGIPACIASAYAAVDQLRGDFSGVEELMAHPVQSLHGGAGQ
ncbi:protoporphyrinogen oxidase [Streptomyces sp. AN091965]|uniref:protoporphyrinogen oxidase n=1 Tax=Streptomyces sp. AN091965 TaxID=2927803 RepID=UPI001F60EE39|nr:protoporphyrinogen oxidase [Streptomyces sp. AN091965]MCI3933669.1 protoporphyrinogen oxidase [Streptomyces sp. AN091965]